MDELVTKAEVARAEIERFYTNYGKAMAAWADLESALCDWFSRAIQPDNAQHVNAEGIFYSARSFAGRADMLKAATSSRLLSEEQRRFVRRALKRATDYNTFRSKLAHRVTIEACALDGKNHAMAMYEGDDPFGRNDYLPAINIDHLISSTLHFDALKWVILITDITGGISLEEGLQLIDRLPKEPHSTADNHLLKAIYEA